MNQTTQRQHNIRVRKTYNGSLDIISDSGNVEMYDMFPHEIIDVLFTCYEMLCAYYASNKTTVLQARNVFNSNTGPQYRILIKRSGIHDTTTISIMSVTDKDSDPYFAFNELTYKEFTDLTHFLNQFVLQKEYVS